MATSSFDEMMVIDTPEAAANLEVAFWEGEARKVLKLGGSSILESLERGAEFFKNNPDWLKEFIAKAKEEMKKESLGTTEDDPILHIVRPSAYNKKY
ncbi:MAG: hypothetical protein LBI08_00855 [Methanomassiliicoccaceae archaeon]|jgi:hypothetical protein|nr:hypothetical protein [Methanomassiliicoccaceae archaeon]